MGIKRAKIEKDKTPLTGVRVIDLTRVIAGPYCSMILGDLGAEIIKIEQPKSGDESRAWGPPWVKEMSAYFISINRNKKSVTLNLKKPEGVKIFKSLVEKADVVLENFRPGTMEELGLGYDTLKEINSRIIYCDITGFGTKGPYRDKPGLDAILQAIGGLMAITGDPAGEPVRVGVPVTDLLTGTYAFGAIASALLVREKTGDGQRISINLLAMQAAMLVYIGSSYLLGGVIAQRWGSAHPTIVPNEAHRAKDGYLIFTVANERMWKSFCHILEMEDLWQHPQYCKNSQRVKNRKALYEIIDRKLAEKTMEEWVSLFDQAGIPCGPINSLDRFFNDPQVLHLGLVKEVEHPYYGKVKMVGPPATFSKGRIAIQNAPPTLGEHNQEVLTRLLGLPDEKVKYLKDQEVI